MGFIFGPIAIEDLTPETIAKMRRQAIDAGIAAMFIRRLNGYQLPTRVRLAIERAYRQKYFEKPVEELTDKEFLSIHNIGPKSLEHIRKLLPAGVK